MAMKVLYCMMIMGSMGKLDLAAFIITPADHCFTPTPAHTPVLALAPVPTPAPAPAPSPAPNMLQL